MAGAESSVARKPLFMLSSSVAACISCSAISHLHNDARTSGGGRRAASADNADWQASAKPVIFSAERYHAASLRSWERPSGHAALAVVRVALGDSAGAAVSDLGVLRAPGSGEPSHPSEAPSPKPLPRLSWSRHLDVVIHCGVG